MNRKEKEEILEWILGKLRVSPSVLMLSEVLDDKEYTAKDIHRWAAEEKDLPYYDKIKEILEVRIGLGMNDGSVNPQWGLKMLGEFFERGNEKSSGEIIFKMVTEEVGL